MTDRKSLADQAVETLAAVAAMGDGLDMEHPERHAIRNLKRTAQKVLENALTTARDLAYQADDLRELCREAKMKENDAR